MRRLGSLVLVLGWVCAPVWASPEDGEGPPEALVELGSDARVLEGFTPRAQAILWEAESFEVLGIVCERGPLRDEDTFRGYPIVATEPVGGPARAEVLEAIYTGVSEGRSFAMCFEPHHGVRARRGDDFVDLVICFECSQIYVYDGEEHPQEEGELSFDDGGPSDHLWVSTSSHALALLDELLGIEDARDRVIAGRTPEGWLEHLEATYTASSPFVRPEDAVGLNLAIDLALDASGGELSYWALEVLAGLGPLARPVVPRLREALRSEWADDWEAALELLGSLGEGGAEALPEVLALLERPRAEIPNPYLPDPDSPYYEEELEDFGPCLDEDTYEDLQIRLIRLLGAMGAEAGEAIPALEALRRGEDPVLADAAAGALEQIRE